MAVNVEVRASNAEERAGREGGGRLARGWEVT